MGSDMAMEANAYRHKPSYAEWDGDDLVIYKDRFYTGFYEFWRGPVTDSNKSLILTMVANIPEKPLPSPHIKNMKYICSLLHDLRRGYMGVPITQELIDTAELIYHELKEYGEIVL